jgi:putative protease
MTTTKNKQPIELLSPAKDLESGKAAINFGADAVYIGALKFGARLAAGNSISDIAKLISYAHRYWAKVYIALNTILFDNELDEAAEIAFNVYDAGADALIIQDMGLLELELPPLPLFASTQTHNYSIEKIQFLEKVGFQRIILARELSLRQLAEIRKKTSVELEYFIHGALCVCFSGQCYLSEATQSRSANRGECAQPCRHPYTLKDSRSQIVEEDKYLLSLKDLNLSGFIEELIHTGINSFKIEGRLKDINYVKNITAYYRKQIDRIIEKDHGLKRASSGKTKFHFQPDPSRTFNRGFTEHFILRRDKNILSLNTPKSLGSYLGRVNQIKSRCFTLDTKKVLHTGDGICFFDRNNVLVGTNINKIDGNLIFASEMHGLKVGSEIFRNYDYSFSKLLHAEGTDRRISIRMQFQEDDAGFTLSMIDEDGIRIQQHIKCEKKIAQNVIIAEKTVRNQLLKLGNTIFQSDSLNIKWKRPYFFPINKLNEFRRRAIDTLEKERLKHLPRQLIKCKLNNEAYPQKHLDYMSNVSNRKAEMFYRRHGVESIEPAFELQSANNERIVMTMKHCLRFQYNLCAGRNAINVEPLYLEDAKFRYRLEFDCNICEMRVILEGKKE